MLTIILAVALYAALTVIAFMFWEQENNAFANSPNWQTKVVRSLFMLLVGWFMVPLIFITMAVLYITVAIPGRVFEEWAYEPGSFWSFKWFGKFVKWLFHIKSQPRPRPQPQTEPEVVEEFDPTMLEEEPEVVVLKVTKEADSTIPEVEQMAIRMEKI